MTLRQFDTVDPQTGEVKTASVYMAPVRVTVAGALPRTDLGFHAVTDETPDGHDTASKGAVTDGMKRAFRGFGVQFGNAFYGDQPSVSAPQPERVPAPSQARANVNGRQSQAPRPTRQSQPAGGDDAQAEKLRKRLFEITAEQGWDDDQVRTVVLNRTGKSIDDLEVSKLGELVDAAHKKLRQMQQAQAA